MNGAQLIAGFELYVDDGTELSSTEELALLNKIYYKVWNHAQWEFTKKEWAATTTGANYIALPADFLNFVENLNYTDNSIADEGGMAPKAVFVNNIPFKVVNWSDRRQYQNVNNVCYVDIVNFRLYFTVAPTAGLAISADYKYQPTALTLSSSPVWPTTMHEFLYHGMAVDDQICQLFDKARSYAKENQAAYDAGLAALALWNSNLQNF